MNDRFYAMRTHQITNLHGRAVTSTDDQVSKIMLDTSLQAMQNVQSGIRAPRVQVVPLDTGLGKSASAYALIAAFAKADITFSAAYVVPTIQMGIEAQHGIEELLGEHTTSLWTSLHKHSGVDRKRAFEELGEVPTRVVDKSTLGAQRVIIVTHKQLEQELATGKAEGTLTFMGQPRSIVFIDEHPELVQQVQVTPEGVQSLHDQLMQSAPDHPWLPLIAEAVYRMSCLTHGSTGQRFLPAALLPLQAVGILDDEAGVSLWDLTDLEASHDVRLAELAVLQRVVQFLRAAAQRRAFYCRKDKAFFAYTLHFETNYPGFVLLDATSELAGLITLNPHVSTVQVPRVNYERLQVSRMDMPGKFRNVPKAIKVPANRDEYGQYIRDSVLANTQAGDDVLVVVHKDVLLGNLIGASDNPDFPMDWEGRKVNTQHYGAGVGSNRFRNKTHVFQFGSFYQPGAVTVAQMHAWSGKSLSAESLALAVNVPGTGGVYSPKGDYKQVYEGNVLRWLKQLGMRGCARTVDGEGKCKAMKLFLTMELGMLMLNMPALFPDAPAPVLAEAPVGLTVAPKQGRQGLQQMLMQGERAIFSAEDIEARTGIPSSKLSREYQALECVLKPLGWSLKSAVEIGKAGRLKYLVHDARFMQKVLLAA